MFENEEHFQVLEENPLEPDAIELSITIRPVIYSIMRQHYYAEKLTEAENIPMWHCLFEINSGKDKAFMLSSGAYGWHSGKREGPDWERTVKLWQKQYDYIRQYIGFAMLSLGELLTDEAQLACGYPAHGYKADWRMLSDQTGAALGAFAEQYREEESKARKNQNWEMVKSQDISARTINAAMYHLEMFFMRLRGDAYVNAGKGKTSLRFSLKALEKLRNCYKSYRSIWDTAASIAESRRATFGPYSDEQWGDVKTEIKQVCLLPDGQPSRIGGIPDELLDELRPLKRNRTYETYHLAYVHAARECGFFMSGPVWPKANNWRVIANALRDYMQSMGETLETEQLDG